MTMVIMNNGAAMQALRENDSPLSSRIIKKITKYQKYEDKRRRGEITII